MAIVIRNIVDRDARPSAVQAAALDALWDSGDSHFLLDQGELEGLGLEATAYTVTDLVGLDGTFQVDLTVQPSTGSTFVTDYPTNATKTSVLIHLFDMKMNQRLRTPVVGSVVLS